MKFSFDENSQIKWPGLKGWVYNTKEEFANASAIIFEVTGSHGLTKTTKSDRVYYVLEGEGEFIIDGKVEKVTSTDVVIVPKGTPYDYSATSSVLKLFLVHAPAFDPSFEESPDKVA